MLNQSCVVEERFREEDTEDLKHTCRLRESRLCLSDVRVCNSSSPPFQKKPMTDPHVRDRSVFFLFSSPMPCSVCGLLAAVGPCSACGTATQQGRVQVGETRSAGCLLFVRVSFRKTTINFQPLVPLASVFFTHKQTKRKTHTHTDTQVLL